jgi:autotransporter adhesin
VAAGQNGSDAVNMNQVNDLRNEVGQSLSALQRSAFGGVASAMAMPSLSPREPGKTVVAVGVANYKGYGAVGAGATYRSRDGAWLINGALSVTPHGDTGARAQVGYEF